MLTTQHCRPQFQEYFFGILGDNFIKIYIICIDTTSINTENCKCINYIGILIVLLINLCDFISLVISKNEAFTKHATGYALLYFRQKTEKGPN